MRVTSVNKYSGPQSTVDHTHHDPSIHEKYVEAEGLDKQLWKFEDCQRKPPRDLVSMYDISTT